MSKDKSIVIRVVDRNNNELVEFSKGIPALMTVALFKNTLISDCDKISK